MKLNTVMEFDHVIQICEDGRLIEVDTIYAPEVLVYTDPYGQILDVHEEDMVEDVQAQGWTLLTGWTGQYGYSGPIMHSSEYVGGALERHILETPGFYACVAVVINADPEVDEGVAGWAVAYRETI